MSDENALLQEKMPSPPPYMEQPRVVMQPQPIVLDNPPGDQFMMSIFTTFCCFMPLGLIALIKSMEARNAYQTGRHEAAAAATRSAKTLNKLAIIINLAILGFVLLIQLTWIIPLIVAIATSDEENKNDDE